jgi:hypothetical protein
VETVNQVNQAGLDAADAAREKLSMPGSERPTAFLIFLNRNWQ